MPVNYCSVVECSQQLENCGYNACKNCYNVVVCDKQDPLHNAKLLRNKGCRSYCGDYAVCLTCALETFQTTKYKKYKSGEERCWCPCCQFDYGALKDLTGSEDVVEELKNVREDFTCSIEGCVPLQNADGRFHWDTYGWCQACEEFTVCRRGAKGEVEHEAALLYHEPYSGEHEGTSFCQACALKAYKEKNPDSKEERCICPLCSYDFGTLKDLQVPYSYSVTGSIGDSVPEAVPESGLGPEPGLGP